MIVTNIYLRFLIGLWAIFLGLVLLKMYWDRDKKNIWGDIYRTANNFFNRSNARQQDAIVYLILGCLSITGGLIALIFGFRLKMIGY